MIVQSNILIIAHFQEHINTHILPFLDLIVMPPTLKKLKGHIALGLSVRASVHASVRYKFKMGF